jgi:hypothetical protein
MIYGTTATIIVIAKTLESWPHGRDNPRQAGSVKHHHVGKIRGLHVGAMAGQFASTNKLSLVRAGRPLALITALNCIHSRGNDAD